MPVLSNIEAHREPRRTGSRRSFIKSVLGLGLLPLATKAKSITDPKQTPSILLQHSPIVVYWQQSKLGYIPAAKTEPSRKCWIADRH